MGSKFHLLETFGKASKLNLTESSFSEISTSNLEHNFFVASIFSVLE